MDSFKKENKILNLIILFLCISIVFIFLFYRGSTIAKEKIKELAIKYRVNTSFLRELFPDELVYLDNGKIVFEPMNPELIRHDYDWDCIEVSNTQYDYIESGTTIGYQGVDVSKFSGDVDWKAVKEEGIHFAMLRIGYRGYSEGKLYTDSYFRQNAVNAYDAGIHVGGYFFSQAITTEEAIEEAEYVLNEIKDLDIRYPIVFDMEDIPDTNARANKLDKEEVTAITIAFCEEIKKAGYIPMIYGNSHWLFSKLDLEKCKDFDIWFAQYHTEPYFPYEFEMWQYTETGTVAGINGNADRNLSFVDYAK